MSPKVLNLHGFTFFPKSRKDATETLGEEFKRTNNLVQEEDATDDNKIMNLW